MSWTQGIAERGDLPPWFLTWADRQKGSAPLAYVTWFGLGEELILDYGEAGALKLSLPESLYRT